MASIRELKDQYERLDSRFKEDVKAGVDTGGLLCFDYEYPGEQAEVVINTDEFTAVCPWTDLPDFGTLTITYVPARSCIELKSLKYYLMSYAGVGIVQEHAANRILSDLVDACKPRRMTIALEYNVRGGLHTTVTVCYEKQ